MLRVLVFDTYRNEPWLVAGADRLTGPILETCAGKCFEFRMQYVLNTAEAAPWELAAMPETVDILAFEGTWEAVHESKSILYWTLKVDRREIHNKLTALYHPAKVPTGSQERVLFDALRHWTPV